MTTYYHGGAPGLTIILPPDVSGARSLADHGAAGITRRDRVYLTTDKTAATMFAALHPSGCGVVYEVVPDGEVEIDPDYIGLHEGESVQCVSAQIVGVYPVAAGDRALIQSFARNARGLNAPKNREQRRAEARQMRRR